MNLVEFPDDGIAFDPAHIVSMVSKFTVPPSREPLTFIYSGVQPHNSTEITLNNGQVFTVMRPFNDVMLVITATLLTSKENPDSLKP